ncbi:MAG: anti-sigma factor [Rhodanobacteraceae bacterium]|nr:MAG: anti-sigma factor [Rhodanobacteraceae bacterium]
MDKTTFLPDETDIQAYVDGWLDEAGCKRVEAWMDHHPGRAAEIRGWRHDAQALRATLGGLPDSASALRLDPAAIRAHHQHCVRARLAWAAVLVLTLGVGGIAGWQMRGIDAPARPPPMADAVQAYRLFAMSRHVPLDVTQQRPGELQAWLDKYFPDAASLPDLAASGFLPVGGRLLATDSGPAALVLYKNPSGGAISFYIRSPAPHAGMLARGQRREGQLAAAYWSGNGYNYALVARADPSNLRILRLDSRR